MQVTSFPFERSWRDFLDGFHHTDAPSLSSLGPFYIGRGHCCDKDFIMSHDDLMIRRLYLFALGNFRFCFPCSLFLYHHAKKAVFCAAQMMPAEHNQSHLHFHPQVVRHACMKIVSSSEEKCVSA